MVYGMAYCPLAKTKELTDLGFDDSKKLTEADRDSLFHKTIKSECSKWIGWSVRLLSPSDISTSMLRRSKYNLNSLSHDTAINLIRSALNKGVDVREVSLKQ